MIKVIQNLLSQEEIDQLLEDVLPKVADENMIYFDKPPEYYGIKKAKCIDYPLIKTIADRLSVPFTRIETAGLLCYPVGAHNSMHMDNCIVDHGKIKRIKPWTHTGIVFLNDNFKGGELVYPGQGQKFTPTIGTFVLAPADETHMHEVTKVESGERYTLVIRFIL